MSVVGDLKSIRNKSYIIDVGMHVGEDTAYYLKKGYAVVAVEANPWLVKAAAQRFASEIASGQLAIVEGAVANGEDDVTFFINPKHTDWSSVHRDIADRDTDELIEVRAKPVNLAGIIQALGAAPFYVKIDIEMADRTALKQLPASALPTYVSVEATGVNLLVDMNDMGYNRFKVVNQGNYYDFKPKDPPLHGKATPGHSYSILSSGPFGEEAPGHWMSYEDAALVYLTLRKLDQDNPGLLSEWCDFHATTWK